MAFFIREVTIDDSVVPITSNEKICFDENVFSLIVGQNATGKSRLLRKIVSHYIFANQGSKRDRYIHGNPTARWNDYSFLSPREEVVVGHFSDSRPSKVIAVSTGRHDRFPSPSSKDSREAIAEYSYIAPSDNGNISSLTQSLIAITNGLEIHPWKFESLAGIFEYLGFAPILDFKISLDPKVKQFFSARKYTERGVDYGEPKNSRSAKITAEIERFVHEYYSLIEYIDHQKSFNYEIHLKYGIKHSFFSLAEIANALRLGVIRVTDLTLNVRGDRSRLKLSQASSGQQCMLVMILGIAGSIEDNALICIDEPEISLHPRWQSDIIGQLQQAFIEYKGCHFIIATHSPQIVSGLTSGNGFVLSLEDKQLYSSEEYSNRSADFQLAEIFNAPGSNNEYLIRISLLLLTKISRYEYLDKKDRDHIEMLSELKDSLSDSDPVRYLIDQIQMLR
ncbi:ATP-binding protein [Pseudomonas cichorii]|nr:ATP-binding protein [Pseudomonas cichorii]